jgi:anaerobic magnesium-protoporphyrin IX monomethyl ester cyclase
MIRDKIVFYYPPVTPETGFPTWEPLQIIFLVRMLREKKIDVEVIDGRIVKAEKRREKIKQAIDDPTICFAVTALTCFQIVDGIDTARFVKEIKPDLPIIFGGWHAGIFAEETLQEKAVDLIVRGQGEVTLSHVLDRFKDNLLPKGIAGVSWKQNGTIIHEADRDITSMDELPELKPEDFEVLDLNYYQISETMFYMSSIGCQYSCKYCCVGAASRQKWSGLSPDRVVSELKTFYDRFAFKRLIFWDNVFFSNKKRVLAICNGLVQEKVNVSWSAHGRINEIVKWDDSFFIEAQAKRVSIRVYRC